MKKMFDLRFVIGLFFLSMGILLELHYFFAEKDQLQDAPVNKWSGLVYLVFGCFMVILSYRKALPETDQ